MKTFLVLFTLLVLMGIAGAGVVLWAFMHYGKDLPAHDQLATYEPPTSTRVHAGDGRLLAEYAIEKRVFVPIEAMPKQLIYGFIAAEDKHFYYHPGVDLKALARAVIQNVKLYAQGRRPVGASTITQQVAKNFLLTNELSITRKIKEAILALRIERALTKDRILELYLNEIYLGVGSYGVAAASLNYFDKSLSELTTAEIAYLAALPKAPNNYHPTRKTEEAIARRNWVIGRMLEEGYVDRAAATEARESPLVTKARHNIDFVEADFFLEEVRRDLVDRFGEKGLYEGGLSVRTTLDTKMQGMAREALRDGLVAYDRRHGWRGAITNIDLTAGWQTALEAVPRPLGNPGWRVAVVTALEEGNAQIGLRGGGVGVIPLYELYWARAYLGDRNQGRGDRIRKAADVLSVGDVILVETVTERKGKNDGDPPIPYPDGTYGLRQIPKVGGGIVAMDPHTGRVLAMTGGWSFELSQFNRATQALRQPGSAFKPFVYLTALENGYTPATIILDAPFVIDQGQGLGKWKPANFSREFFGPSPMRLGIEKSRNLMTVRLAQAIGMDKVSETAARFGIAENMPPQLAMSLGAAEVKLINMVTAYSALVNGGKKVVPSLIDRVQDKLGKTIFRHDGRGCADCIVSYWDNQPMPHLADERPQLTDPAAAYQIVTMLEGVVQRGTGRRIRAIGKPLAGKTGTTNDSRDTWFIGFAPDLAVGVFVGFDTPIPLGKQPWGGQETGSSVAAPIFKAFMEKALDGKPAIPFRTPPGVRMVRIDAQTGKVATAASKKIITEAFKAGTEPSAGKQAVFISGGTEIAAPAAAAAQPGAVPLPTVPTQGQQGGEAPSGLY